MGTAEAGAIDRYLALSRHLGQGPDRMAETAIPAFTRNDALVQPSRRWPRASDRPHRRALRCGERRDYFNAVVSVRTRVYRKRHLVPSENTCAARRAPRVLISSDPAGRFQRRAALSAVTGGRRTPDRCLDLL